MPTGAAWALNKLFGWDLWFAIVLLGIVAGTWAIYGGLSVAWTDLFTVIVMIPGGVLSRSPPGCCRRRRFSE